MFILLSSMIKVDDKFTAGEITAVNTDHIEQISIFNTGHSEVFMTSANPGDNSIRVFESVAEILDKIGVE